MEKMIQMIQIEVARLRAGTDFDPYAGISVRLPEEGERDAADEGDIVVIYDDQMWGYYSAPLALAALAALPPLDWEAPSDGSIFEPIWQALACAEV